MMFREARDNWGISQVLNALGDVMRISGNYAKARGLYEESLALYRKLDIRPDIPASLHNLGYVALAEGDTTRARELFAEALGLQLAQRNRQGVAECIAGLAGVAAALGQGERSARLYGALVAQGYGKGVIMWAAEQIEFERNQGRARALLDEDSWQKAWTEGRAMMLEQAIAYALEERD
jgi:tetratricopeptide (TPR) repeat protein